jgi:hypothetical protein
MNSFLHTVADLAHQFNGIIYASLKLDGKRCTPATIPTPSRDWRIQGRLFQALEKSGMGGPSM